MLDAQGLTDALNIAGVVGIYRAAKGMKRKNAQTASGPLPKPTQASSDHAIRLPSAKSLPVQESSELLWVDVSVSTARPIILIINFVL
jgi:hypothetical protein